MPDSRFYRRAGPQSLSQIAGIAEATLSGSFDPHSQITDVATLESATSADLVYVSDKKFLAQLATTKAIACLITPDLAHAVPATCTALTCTAPRAAFAKVATSFYPDTSPAWSVKEFISPQAEIDPTAIVAASAVVGANVKIGARTKLGPHAVIASGVIIGADCLVGLL